MPYGFQKRKHQDILNFTKARLNKLLFRYGIFRVTTKFLVLSGRLHWSVRKIHYMAAGCFITISGRIIIHSISVVSILSDLILLISKISGIMDMLIPSR